MMTSVCPASSGEQAIARVGCQQHAGIAGRRSSAAVDKHAALRRHSEPFWCKVLVRAVLAQRAGSSHHSRLLSVSSIATSLSLRRSQLLISCNDDWAGDTAGRHLLVCRCADISILSDLVETE